MQKLNTKRTILTGLAFLSICTFWQIYDSIDPFDPEGGLCHRRYALRRDHGAG